MKQAIIVIVLAIICLLMSSCGPGQAFGPTITPSQTSTNTPIPTPTITSTPVPTATITPIPTATFPVNNMNNQALNLVDAKVTVEGELVTVTFYLKDIPEEMPFRRKGVQTNLQVYFEEKSAREIVVQMKFLDLIYSR